MHEKKLIPAAIVVAIAFGCWFVPAPAGLCRASVDGEIASVANSIAFDAKKKILVGQVSVIRAGWTAYPLLDEVENVEAPSGASDLSDKQIAALREADDLVRAGKTAEELGQRSWRLFVIFAATIVLILLNTMPIFTAAIVALSLSILTGTLTPSAGYSGFTKDFIILIVVAFSVAIGVTKSGLGQRIAWWIISKFGSSSLGLGYSLIITDMLIAPAFPSNTARSGVLFPVMDAVAKGRGSNPEPGTRHKLGAFLALNSVLGLSLSSGMWMTAMAANPGGADAAAKIIGSEISFLTWAQASCVPTLVAFFTVPVILYRVFRPELRSTPEAPQAAREALAKMGPMSRSEIIMSVVFVVLVVTWRCRRCWL